MGSFKNIMTDLEEGERLTRGNDARIGAQEDGDLAKYSRMCIEGGYTPEDIDDFELGLGLARFEQECIERLLSENEKVSKEAERVKRYKGFLGEFERTTPNVGLLRNVLPQYFPGKFGPSGRTPVSSMSDGQVLGTFNGLRKYAESVVYSKYK